MALYLFRKKGDCLGNMYLIGNLILCAVLCLFLTMMYKIYKRGENMSRRWMMFSGTKVAPYPDDTYDV